MKYTKILTVNAIALCFLASCSPDSQGKKFTHSSNQGAAESAIATTESIVVSTVSADTKAYSKETEVLISELLNQYAAPSVEGSATPNGFVNYKAWLTNSSDRIKLNQVLESIAITDLTDFTDNEKKAFYINAYNMMTVDLMLSHYFELENNQTKYKKSILNILDSSGKPLVFNVWKTKKWAVAGKIMTLNQVESDQLIPMGDARIHFAINCASVGCPPLLNEAYYAETLDEQLEAASKFYVNQSEYVKIVDGSLVLSEIFKWYAGDFASDTSGKYIDVNSFIDFYIDDAKKASIKSDDINYYEYIWELNEQ